MAAPEFVPVKPQNDVRTYESPPRRPDQWHADRPGDLVGRQPLGAGMGVPGPDQGYALKLADDVFRPLLRTGRLSTDDAIAGCLGVALKRASLFGRAPTAHDLRIAFTMWGFLDESPAADLVALREQWFAEVGHVHHYAESRRIVDAASDDVLRQQPGEIEAAYRAGWKSLIAVATGGSDHG